MMPSFRKKVAGFIRQLSNPGVSITESETGEEDSIIRPLKLPISATTTNAASSPSSNCTGSFIQQYLNGEVHRFQPDILFGRSYQELPVKEISPLTNKICAAFTGPTGGLTKVNRKVRHVDVMDPNLDFVDVGPFRHTAQLAEPEDLEEFMVEENEQNDSSNTTTTAANKQQQQQQHAVRNCNKEQSRNMKSSSSESNGHATGKCHNGNDHLTGRQQNQNQSENGGGGGGSGLQTSNKRRTWTESRTPDDDLRLAEDIDVLFLEGNEDDFKRLENKEVAGVFNWNRSHPRAFGCATTLYERHPVTNRNAGEPIADAFAICARDNNAILVLADGVNWGEKSCLAARCAVHGCVDYINKTMFESRDIVQTTKDVFLVLLRSLFAAHNLILQEDGMLTTLCVAFVCPLADTDTYVVCTCNVGDSLAYVFSKSYGVREITQGSHDIYSMRDMRDALGALGPVDGPNPELNNLTCSMTVVDESDIVFLTSDGISDNFDPVVGKFALPREDNNNRSTPSSSSSSSMTTTNGPPQTQTNNKQSGGGQRHGQVTEDSSSVASVTSSSGGPPPPPPTISSSTNVAPPTLAPPPLLPTPFDFGLPTVEAHQRHALTLLRMEDLLNNGVTEGDAPCTDAKQLCDALIDFAYKLTVAKRRILEDPDLYVTGEEYISATEQKKKRRRLGEKLAMVPGKLDHASVVAYQVGRWPTTSYDECDFDGQTMTDVVEMDSTKTEPVVRTEMSTCNSEFQFTSCGGAGSNKENLSPNPKPKTISSLSLVCHRSLGRESSQKESLV